MIFMRYIELLRYVEAELALLQLAIGQKVGQYAWHIRFKNLDDEILVKSEIADHPDRLDNDLFVPLVRLEDVQQEVDEVLADRVALDLLVLAQAVD